jgi:hypothetical protein
MKTIKLSLLLAAATFAATATGHAQIISWSGPYGISGDSDVKANGSYVDAVQGAPEGFNGKDSVVETVNTVAFNPNPAGYGDGTIVISGPGLSAGTDGGTGTGSASYQAVLADCIYVVGTTGTVTMNDLISGHQYQVEVWNSTPYDATSYSDTSATDSVTGLVNTYVVGKFTATGGSAAFNFGAPPPGTASTSGAYVLDAVSVRDLSVPEPSTYAMMLAGLGSLVWFARRKRA